MPLMVRPFRLGAILASGPDANLVTAPDVTIQPMPPVYLGPPVPAPGFPPGQICPAWGCGSPPIRNYIPIPLPPVSTPTSDGSTPVNSATSTLPAPGSTIVVTPTSGPIPPPSTPIIPASSPGILDWLQGSMFGGIPNWVLAGAAALLFFGGKHR